MGDGGPLTGRSVRLVIPVDDQGATVTVVMVHVYPWEVVKNMRKVISFTK